MKRIKARNFIDEILGADTRKDQHSRDWSTQVERFNVRTLARAALWRWAEKGCCLEEWFRVERNSGWCWRQVKNRMLRNMGQSPVLHIPSPQGKKPMGRLSNCCVEFSVQSLLEMRSVALCPHVPPFSPAIYELTTKSSPPSSPPDWW